MTRWVNCPFRRWTSGSSFICARFMETGTLPRKSARMLAMSCSIQWPLKLPRKLSRAPRENSLVVKRHTGRTGRKEAIRVAPIARRRTSILALTATLGLVLIVTGGTLGYRWTYPHMADEVTAAGKTGPPAPTDYLSSLALDSACPRGAACGADRITTQRGRCTRGFSQAATRAANIV